MRVATKRETTVQRSSCKYFHPCTVIILIETQYLTDTHAYPTTNIAHQLKGKLIPNA